MEVVDMAGGSVVKGGFSSPENGGSRQGFREGRKRRGGGERKRDGDEVID